MRTKTVLTTRRLRLRTWRASDVAPYNRNCNTSQVMDVWLGGVVSPRRLKLEVRYFQRGQERDGYTFWVIERKRDKAFVGFCGLIRVRERRSSVLGEVEIGWRIRADMWRKGYAEEAAVATLKYGFAKLNCERIISRVSPGNVASRGLMGKLGMHRAPQLDYVDPADGMRLIVYAIDRSAARPATEPGDLT